MRDFAELMTHALRVAVQSLRDTPRKLRVLAEAGVVDAGAKGFVDFLEGVMTFINTGKMRRPAIQSGSTVSLPVETLSANADIRYRYCTEALIKNVPIDAAALRSRLNNLGDSLIIAGSPARMRLHIHTNQPAEVFSRLWNAGLLAEQKVDDMIRQYQVVHARQFPIALVTDSACESSGGVARPLSDSYGASQTGFRRTCFSG